MSNKSFTEGSIKGNTKPVSSSPKPPAPNPRPPVQKS